MAKMKMMKSISFLTNADTKCIVNIKSCAINVLKRKASKRVASNVPTVAKCIINRRAYGATANTSVAKGRNFNVPTVH